MKSDMFEKARSLYTEGTQLFSAGKTDEARIKFIQASSIVPAAFTTEERQIRAGVLNMLGVCEMWRSHFGTAFDLFYEATSLVPLCSDYWVYFSQAAARLGLKEQPIAFCQKGIQCNPQSKLAYEAMGMICKEQRKYKEAAQAFQTAYDMNPSARNAHYLADIYQWAGLHEEAFKWYEKTFALEPEYADAHFSKTFFMMKLWKLEEAKFHAEKGCKSETNGLLSRYNLSLINLTLGNLTEGWRDHECRLKFKENESDSSIVANRFRQSVWNGQTHVDDHGTMRPSIVHAHTEQGFGDTFQFCRYLPMIAKKGCKVNFECQANMLEMMIYNFPEANVVCRAPDYPGTHGLPDFDYHVPLMSLPYVFGTTLENVPSKPYLKAIPEYIEKWEKVKSLPGLKVGICWAGEKRTYDEILAKIDDRRSMNYEMLNSIMDVPDVSFVSLQMGKPLEQARGDDRLNVLLIESWSDTAAIIHHLDLVITVDTAVLHVAAGMGKPTWLFNRFDTCWRWMLDRRDSPWYPSLTLFRQREQGDWRPVVKEVHDELWNIADATKNVSHETEAA